MHDAMLVRGFALRTRQADIETVAKLASSTTSAQIGWRRIRSKLGCCTWSGIAGCPIAPSTKLPAAYRFLYGRVLQQDRATLPVPLAKTPERQPEILARAELAALFAASDSLKSRTLLQTADAAGLRVSELCALRIADIDSQPDRMCLRVHVGKGGQDRCTLFGVIR
jgi:site-specific recombinase XerD